jgi:Co/Zn/Cd efflux system component
VAHHRSALAFALGLNTVVATAEVVSGIGSNSLSLIVDGIHNVSDEVVLALLVLAYTLRTGPSGRLLRRVNLLNAAGLFAISAPLTWQANLCAYGAAPGAPADRPLGSRL